MKTAVSMELQKGNMQRLHRFLINFFSLAKKSVTKFFNYIHHLFRPTKELKPEIKEEIEHLAERSDDVSPFFTSTKDAAKWLESKT